MLFFRKSKLKEAEKEKEKEKGKEEKLQKPKKQKIKRKGVLIDKILKAPYISEKGTELTKNNQYIFKVSKDATKNEIKKNVAAFYGVDVISVKTINIPPKKRKFRKTEGWKKGFKKAIVKLKEGQKIEAIER